MRAGLNKPARADDSGTATSGGETVLDNPSLTQNQLLVKLSAAWDAWHADPHNRRLELAFCKLAQAVGLPCYDSDGNPVSWRAYYENTMTRNTTNRSN